MLVEAAGLRWRAFAVATARETAAELMRAAMFAELVVGRAREAECAGKRRTNFPSSRHLERRRSTKLISRSPDSPPTNFPPITAFVLFEHCQHTARVEKKQDKLVLDRARLRWPLRGIGLVITPSARAREKRALPHGTGRREGEARISATRASRAFRARGTGRHATRRSGLT